MKTQVVSDCILTCGRVASEISEGPGEPVVDLIQSQLVARRLEDGLSY